MAPFVRVRKGTAFWPIPTTQRPDPHPWIVISRIVNDKALAVNLSDAEHFPGSPCAIARDEYAELRKPSVVAYQYYKEIDVVALGRALGASSGINHLSDIPAALLDRIIFGAKNSADIPAGIKRKYGLI